MAEISFGIGKAGIARGSFAGAGLTVKRGAVAKVGAGAKRGAETRPGGGRRERSGNRVVGGAARLKEAVDRKLRGSSGELASLLLEKARAGDMPSLRLLVSLAERHKPRERVVDPGPLRSQALAWAAEPQWVDPPDEGLEGECK